VGEASRRKGLFQLPSALSRIRVDADIILPGMDRELLQETSDRAAGKRRGLGKALSQTVCGEGQCIVCKRTLTGLDELGSVIAIYMEVAGRAAPGTPSWILCDRCTDAGHAEDIAGRLVDQYMEEQGLQRIRYSG
jgi:hypothetical protein